MRGRDDARQGGVREQRGAGVDGNGGATATQEERRRLELEEREAALRRREMELWERERRLLASVDRYHAREKGKELSDQIWKKYPK
ncbi:hypothetical protein CBOM_06389 [Ceraceosorus bombacis]|uniref:Uncharacterized protein n=1 Tax=Ceraceosorus bombacis TaxID=401625 RepID=A0A0N7LAF5_9BASI|nr:hypothetical protein CBOM_06389 [Ceraceosorus bombacis]